MIKRKLSPFSLPYDSDVEQSLNINMMNELNLNVLQCKNMLKRLEKNINHGLLHTVNAATCSENY